MAKAIKTLEERFNTLKLKEAKLEADLAIRDCPELQQPIAEIILAYVDARKAFEAYELVAPLGPTKIHLDAAYKQVALWKSKLDYAKIPATAEGDKQRNFYTKKLAEAQEAVDHVCDAKYTKMKTARDKTKLTLQTVFNERKHLAGEHALKWSILLPSLEAYLTPGSLA